MFDSITQICNSTIHHGQNSKRAYLMSLGGSNPSEIIDELNNIAINNDYTKIVAKVPAQHIGDFVSNGYETEALIPKLYNNEIDGYFLCKYMDKNRKNNKFSKECNEILNIAKQKKVESPEEIKDENIICRQATETDVLDIITVYRKVFETYPFPIHDKNYILKTMNEDVIYFGIWNNGKLVALSSIELSKKYSNAEMTDFAVLEEYRGKKYALYLLNVMENKLKDLGIKTAYTIARAMSAGMNITFAKCGYKFAGTLINNTDISGQIESMNVWYKNII